MYIYKCIACIYIYIYIYIYIVFNNLSYRRSAGAERSRRGINTGSDAGSTMRRSAHVEMYRREAAYTIPLGPLRMFDRLTEFWNVQFVCTTSTVRQLAVFKREIKNCPTS